MFNVRKTTDEHVRLKMRQLKTKVNDNKAAKT